MTIEITARPGNLFSAAEHQEFIALVLRGGEVPEHTLRRNVPGAPRLVFLREGASLHGVAALKAPINTYRTTIRNKSGVAVPSDVYPFELGYIFVAPQARRRGHSSRLVDAALSGSDEYGIFSTSREDNFAMHRTLARYGFAHAGKPYHSQEDQQRRLQLFLREVGADRGGAGKTGG